MLLQSLSALCLAPVGSGSVWKYLEALVRPPGVSGRIACGFRTELHFADEGAAGITKVKVMKAPSTMPSPPPASNNAPRLNSKDLTSEPEVSLGMRVRMATIWMWMSRKKHRKPMMDQRSMWRTEGIVLESVKIGQYISGLQNMIMAKQMQRQAMYLKRRLYCNK